MREHIQTLIGVLLFGLLLLTTGLLVGRDALAQGSGPAIDSWVIAGGGAPATGDDGRVALHDTMGQPVVGSSSGAGGAVALSAGYWTGGVPVYRIYLPLVLRQ